MRVILGSYIYYGEEALQWCSADRRSHNQTAQNIGLTFKDETKASHLLDHIGYFRFKSYLLPLLHNKQTGTFKSGVTLEDVYTLYMFDTVLRKLICAHHSRLWNKILQNSSFTTCQKQLLKYYPSADIKATDFPPTWETESLWYTKS